MYLYRNIICLQLVLEGNALNIRSLFYSLSGIYNNRNDARCIVYTICIVIHCIIE